MADLGGQFDAEQVAPLGDRSPIPAGEYLCAAVKSEWKPTTAGTGRYLEFTWQVIEGEHKGRMLWSRLNLENPSQQAVAIARSELSSICRATNKLKPRDTSELHDIAVMLSVAIKKREDNGEPTNEIKGYKNPSGSTPELATASSSPASESKPNWM